MKKDFEPGLVSVLMCAHNESAYIRQSVGSVLAETSVPIQLVVVDDRSSDDTGEILQMLSAADDRLKVVHRVDDVRLQDEARSAWYYPDHGYGGQTDALNLGLRFCDGEFIARLDADDVNLPGRLREQLSYMLRYPDVGLLGCDLVRMDAKGNEMGEYFPMEQSHDDIIAAVRDFRGHMAHSGWFVRRQVYVDLGGYRRDGGRAEDFDFLLRASEKRGMVFAYLNRPLIKLRMQDGRLSSAISLLPTIHAIVSLVMHKARMRGVSVDSDFEGRLYEMVEHDLVKGKWHRYLLGYRYKSNAYFSYRRGDVMEMLKYGFRAAVVSPRVVFSHGDLAVRKLGIANKYYRMICEAG